jgi:hypothetical protein
LEEARPSGGLRRHENPHLTLCKRPLSFNS